MKIILSFVAFFSLTAGVFGQAIPRYHSRTSFALTPPGAMGVGLYGFDNPALLDQIHQIDLAYAWSLNSGSWGNLSGDTRQWGFFGAVPHVGFGVVHYDEPNSIFSVNDYRLGLGWGSNTFASGISYGWSTGDASHFGRKPIWTAGYLIRPIRYASLGLVLSTTTGGVREGVADLAIRPLGTEALTLFGDYAIQNKAPADNAEWSVGAAVEALPGVRITGRYFDSKLTTIGLQFSLGRIGLSSQSHFDKDSKHTNNSYMIRLGSYDRNILRSTIQKNKFYTKMDLFGKVSYQRYLLFDKATTLVDILDQIEAAKQDPAIAGLAINTSGMNINREMAWEIREKLKAFKSAGKKVVIFIDRPGIDDYHLASVADKIVLDQTGMVVLEGFVMGRTFVKGTLEKLGIGFDEWRFFKYKSANEALSRDKMSEGDREQRQALIDGFYAVAKADICEARGLTAEQFDDLVNGKFILMPKDALAAGLVDTLGRWDTAEKMIEQIEGSRKRIMPSVFLEEPNLPPDNYWSEKPKIAVIYAIGACAMDEGIRARSLVKDVNKAVNDKRIKAIVLRVDSPGGDAMASDYIADALRRAKGKKPVIVSQGFVAASGGYWLSMYADTIVAAPQTITGSIGVIGGWFYNEGLKEKLGFTTDHVKVGNHADLGFGFALPLVGGGLPDRNLTPDERSAAEGWIKELYEEFVNYVAAGRKRTHDEIHEVAQGRVWTGLDGKNRGLVDVIGGLETAVELAKSRAGLMDQPVDLIYLPKPQLLDPSFFSPKLVGMEWRENLLYKELEFRLKNNGQVMPILPLDYVEME